MSERKTPQEKKALSYKKDRRNVYGANDKASRKNIPLRKKKQNRAYRKKANQILSEAQDAIDFEEIELIENDVKSVKKGDWKKNPDAPLGEVVKGRLEYRKQRVGKGKMARRKAREAIKNLTIKVYQETENKWVAKVIGLVGVDFGIEVEGQNTKGSNYRSQTRN